MEEGYPDQIALGDHSYFLLYQAAAGERNSRIIQYGYDSGRIRECTVPDIATITFRNGYLLLGEWEYDGDIEDRYYYSEPYFNSFYAHGYVKETDFGGQMEPLKPDHNGKCQIGTTEMYFHTGGYFFSEPEAGDYGGTSGGYFRAGDKEIHYRAQTGQEERNRSMLLKEMGAGSGDNDWLYETHEHQEKSQIYGICNTHRHWLPHHPAKQENVIRSYAYRIDPDKEEITILGQGKNCIGIAVSETVFVYQKDNEIIQEDMETGEKKVIYHIKNIYGPDIYVNGDYLLVTERDKNLFSGKQDCYPVRWKEKP